MQDHYRRKGEAGKASMHEARKSTYQPRREQMRRTINLLCLVILLLSFTTTVFTDAAIADETFQPYDLPGMAAVQGTRLQVAGGGGADIVVESSETVRLTVQSMSETIVIGVDPVGGAASARFTIAGLAPNATYYKYQDDLHTAEVITTDANGAYAFDQDISASHTVHLFTKHSTLFLWDDATGGDCASIGAWDAAGKTCTLAMDLTDTIQINSSGITLDGNGHTISGSGTNYGVYATNVSGIVVKNLSITGFSKGIMFDSEVYSSSILSNTLYGNGYAIELWRFSRGNTIRDNQITGNSGWSVHLNLGCNNNLLENNTFTSNNSAIYFINAHYNTFKKNTIDNMTWDGISFYWSCINTIESNTISHTNRAINYYGKNWCGSTVFRGNTISDNNTGMYLQAPANTVYRNNFINNGLQIYNDPEYADTSVYQGNKFNLDLPTGGNYFSSFDTHEEGCVDSNGDGVCDSAFVFSNGQDNFPFNHPVTLNSVPVANAGADQTVPYNVAEAGATVVLDGTASSDPDGDTLTYAWTWAGGSATGQSPSVLFPVGRTVVTLTVDDGNGATATDTVEINVIYAFGGYLQPVSLNRSFKTGSVIPVKFQLFDAAGAGVPTAAARISIVQMSDQEPVSEVMEGTSNVPDSGNLFRYDPASLQYVYNLSTDTLGIGNWRILVTLDDSRTYTADIGLK